MAYKFIIATGAILMATSNVSYAVDYAITQNVVNQKQTLDPRAGAIYLQAGDTLTSSDGISFSNNNASVMAGAIENFRGNVTIGNNNKFIGNTITSPNDSTQPGQPRNGAAIANWGVLNIGDNVLFQNNVTTNKVSTVSSGITSYGGAIYNKKADASVGQITIGNNARFIGNKVLGNSGSSYSNGGAIYNYMGTITIGANSLFSGNQALGNGGAINNEGGTMTIGAGAVFKDNAALPNQMLLGPDYFSTGGVVRNWANGTINFLGDVTFSGNMANGALNDIANGGAINFADNSTIIFDGGIMNTDSGSSITFGNNTLLTVKLLSTPFISADTITIGSNSKIADLIIGKGVVGTGIALTDGTLSGDFVFDSADYTNALYNVTYNGNGLFDVVEKTTDEIVASTGKSAGEIAMAQAVLTGTSHNAKFNAIQDAIGTMMQTRGVSSVDQALTAAATLAPTAAPVTQSNSTQTANQVFSVVGGRFDGGSSVGGSASSSSMYGMSSGDMNMGDFTVWATGMYNKAKLNTDNGFDSKSKGIAAGLEVENQMFKLGAGYAYTSTDVDATNRDTDIKSNTVILYGQYKPNEWYANLVGSYTFAKNEETKNVAGIYVDGENDVNTIAMQLMGGYEYYTQRPDIVEVVSPEVGLRWMNIDSGKYTDSAGTVVESDRSNILTAVAQVKMNSNFDVSEGFRIRPKVSFGVTYDFARDDNRSVVTLANGSAFSVEGEALNRFGSEVEAGLHFLMGPGFDLSLSYEGKFRSHYTDHTGVLNARYQF